MTNFTLQTGSHNYPTPTSRVAAPVASERTTSTYYLPSGEPIQVADDLSRGQLFVSFQLVSGKIVKARRASVRPTVRVDAVVPSRATLLGHGGY